MFYPGIEPELQRRGSGDWQNEIRRAHPKIVSTYVLFRCRFVVLNLVIALCHNAFSFCFSGGGGAFVCFTGKKYWYLLYCFVNSQFEGNIWRGDQSSYKAVKQGLLLLFIPPSFFAIVLSML